MGDLSSKEAKGFISFFTHTWSPSDSYSSLLVTLGFCMEDLGSPLLVWSNPVHTFLGMDHWSKEHQGRMASTQKRQRRKEAEPRKVLTLILLLASWGLWAGCLVISRKGQWNVLALNLRMKSPRNSLLEWIPAHSIPKDRRQCPVGPTSSTYSQDCQAESGHSSVDINPNGWRFARRPRSLCKEQKLPGFFFLNPC